MIISLIIPTRNRSESLKILLDSLESHNWLKFPDIEVLVVDNASDNCITQKLCSLYSIKYLYVDQTGQRNALNKGIQSASGDLLAFTDDDVIISSSDWLYRMADHFKEYSNLGYVSGNVKALETSTNAQKIWEKRGGLSKGNVSIFWSNDELISQYKFKIWPLIKICAGANSMIPRSVFEKVGLFHPLFDPGAPIPHGGSLEIGYRIIKAGYDLFYDHQALVFHQHPKTEKELHNKMFIYGIGDTAIHAYFFGKYRDYRSLWWAFGGYQLDLLNKIFKSVIGKYPLPLTYLLVSLLGSLYGSILPILKSKSFIELEEK
jgi:glycosyltransferase involved in cell wall biosynthesis